MLAPIGRSLNSEGVLESPTRDVITSSSLIIIKSSPNYHQVTTTLSPHHHKPPHYHQIIADSCSHNCLTIISSPPNHTQYINRVVLQRKSGANLPVVKNSGQKVTKRRLQAGKTNDVDKFVSQKRHVGPSVGVRGRWTWACLGHATRPDHIG